MIVNGSQIRAARAFLGWHQNELAAAAGVHRNWIRALEQARTISARQRRDRKATLERVERALVEAGIEIRSYPVGVFLK